MLVELKFVPPFHPSPTPWPDLTSLIADSAGWDRHPSPKLPRRHRHYRPALHPPLTQPHPSNLHRGPSSRLDHTALQRRHDGPWTDSVSTFRSPNTAFLSHRRLSHPPVNRSRRRRPRWGHPREGIALARRFRCIRRTKPTNQRWMFNRTSWWVISHRCLLLDCPAADLASNRRHQTLHSPGFA